MLRKGTGSSAFPKWESKQAGSRPLPSAATAAGDSCEPQKLLALSTTENKSMRMDKHAYICAGTWDIISQKLQAMEKTQSILMHFYFDYLDYQG